MKAIEVLDAKNLTIGHVRLGSRSGNRGSVRQQVHDGDTVAVEAAGDFGVRLLGVDAPEISFRLPGGTRFVSLGDPQWQRFLADPFAAEWPRFKPELSHGLRQFLHAKLGPEVAEQHHRYAQLAEDAFEDEIQRDMQALGQTAETFLFFLAFAFEVMDGYGRFLCYINREQPNPTQPAPRPLTYNERLLTAGRTFPYFIWPNINPWRKADSITAAVIPPGEARRMAESDESLRRARQSVQRARSQHLGIFDARQPLLLEPFELRYLARRSLPDRWLIDLTSDAAVLLPPAEYYRIPHPEDRLFIPSEYVPLFVEQGWKRGA